MAATKNLDNYDLKEKFIQSKIAKKTYKSRQQAFINKQIRAELKLIHHILANQNKFNSYNKKKQPDFITLGDSSLEARGGFTKALF